MTARVETCGGDVAATGAISSTLIAGPHGSCFNSLIFIVRIISLLNAFCSGIRLWTVIAYRPKRHITARSIRATSITRPISGLTWRTSDLVLTFQYHEGPSWPFVAFTPFDLSRVSYLNQRQPIHFPKYNRDESPLRQPHSFPNLNLR